MDRRGDTGREEWMRRGQATEAVGVDCGTLGRVGESADGEASEPTMLDQLDLNSTGSGRRVGELNSRFRAEGRELTLNIVTVLT